MMEIPDPILGYLLRELEDQISACHQATRKRGAWGQTALPLPGFITIEVLDDDYLNCLKVLRSKITDCLGGISQSPWQDLRLPSEPFLWRFLALAGPSGCFIDPLHMRRRLNANLEISRRPGPHDDDDNQTRDFWENEVVQKWTTTGQPSQILLETASPRPARLLRFGIELVENLRKHHPVISMLGNNHLLFDGMVVEQLVLQVFRHVSPKKPLLFLAQTLSVLSGLWDQKDYFGALREACSAIPKVTVVLDLTSLPLLYRGSIVTWVTGFDTVATALCGKCDFRVAMFCPRRLISDSHGPLAIHVVSAEDPIRMARPGHLLPRERPIPLEIKRSVPVGGAIADGPSSQTSEVIKDLPKEGGEKDLGATTLDRSGLGTPVPTLESSYIPETCTVGPLASTPTETILSRTQSIAPNLTHAVSSEAPKVASDTPHEPPSSPKTRDQIQIAIMCALTLEADAVEALFDDYWEDVEPNQMKAPGDSNAYSFGVIGTHRIVLVHMPSMGKSSGAIVASNCRSSFPNVKLALVVGICGGVPLYDNKRQEVVLGDVIISEGLIGYDFGRRFPDRFVRKAAIPDSFGKPGNDIRALLNKLKGRRGGRRLKEQTFRHLLKLREELGSVAEYPGAGEDHLYQATYRHMHNDPNVCKICSREGTKITVCDQARASTCEKLQCDKSSLVSRRRLDAIILGTAALEPLATSPAVHFGYVASADQVMKSGEHRDGIAEEEDVIAFEMEAAGVWDIMPCLVIKGVCDYADSHKSKKWQYYAAATAAACTKAFLGEW